MQQKYDNKYKRLYKNNPIECRIFAAIMTKQNSYLASKPRYEILDGLRGVAAMIVVAFHLLETYYHMAPDQPINHGYLAVDFFFALSGFVIGYAYDDRWDRMSAGNFFKRRLVRLHPMLMFGTLFGALMFYFEGDMPGWEAVHQTPWWMLMLVMLWGFTLIPLPNKFDIRGWQEMHPLNNAQWSLMWEYIANVLYAFVIRHFHRWMLTAFVLLSACLTVCLCMNIDIFGVLSENQYPYTVIGGWSLDPMHLLIAITRLFYPFFMGLLLSRMFTGADGGRKMLRLESFSVRGGFWWCTLAIIILLAVSRLGGDDVNQLWMNGLYEAFVIIACFPLIIALGAGSKITDQRGQAVCKFMGDISYPLYITHYPFIYLQMSFQASHPDLPTSTHIAIGVSLFLLAIFVAYASLKLYDLPIREWLKKKLF